MPSHQCPCIILVIPAIKTPGGRRGWLVSSQTTQLEAAHIQIQAPPAKPTMEIHQGQSWGILELLTRLGDVDNINYRQHQQHVS